MAIIELGAMFSLKKYTITGVNSFFGLGLIGYLIIACLLTSLFRYVKLGIANHSWNIITSIAGFIIGYVYFGETITIMEICGFIISSIGVVMMLS